MAKQSSKDKQTIADLIPDDKNFNGHSEFGTSLLQKSMQKYGAGRSILIDRNNKIIAGNGVVEMASQIGIEDLQIVESDGKKIIAVKRMDIDLDSLQGREMALADNQVAAKNIVIDAVLVEAVLGEAICEEWAIKPNSHQVQFNVQEKGQPTEWNLTVKFKKQSDCKKLFDRLSKEGFDVNMLT